MNQRRLPLFPRNWVIHYKAMGYKDQPKWGILALFRATSATTLYSASGGNRDNFRDRGFALHNYGGLEVRMSVGPSPDWARNAFLGHTDVGLDLSSSGQKPAFRIMTELKSTHACISPAARPIVRRDNFTVLIYDVLVCSGVGVRGKLDYVLPRLGVSTEDVVPARNALLAAIAPRG